MIRILFLLKQVYSSFDCFSCQFHPLSAVPVPLSRPLAIVASINSSQLYASPPYSFFLEDFNRNFGHLLSVHLDCHTKALLHFSGMNYSSHYSHISYFFHISSLQCRHSFISKKLFKA